MWYHGRSGTLEQVSPLEGQAPRAARPARALLHGHLAGHQQGGCREQDFRKYKFKCFLLLVCQQKFTLERKVQADGTWWHGSITWCVIYSQFNGGIVVLPGATFCQGYSLSGSSASQLDQVEPAPRLSSNSDDGVFGLIHVP